MKPTPTALIAPAWKGDDAEYSALLTALFAACPAHSGDDPAAACTCERVLADCALLDRWLYVRRTNTTYLRELAEHRAVLALGGTR